MIMSIERDIQQLCIDGTKVTEKALRTGKKTKHFAENGHEKRDPSNKS